MSLLNRYVLVRYNVGGPELWHERLALEHVSGEEYIIVTPDRDLYVEELSAANEDLIGVRARPARGVLPPGIAAAAIYPLPPWTAAELTAIRGEARTMLAAERNLRGGGGGAPVGGVAEADGAGTGKVVDPYSPGQLKWLSCEKCGNFVYGQEIGAVTEALVKDAKSVYDAGDGVRLFVQCIDGGERDVFLGRNVRGDSRVLPVHLNAMGQPERTLREVASLSREVEVKWSLPGPRTTQWCINYLAIEGLGFEGHHERLRQMCRLEATYGESRSTSKFQWHFDKHYWWISWMVATFLAPRFSSGGFRQLSSAMQRKPRMQRPRVQVGDFLWRSKFLLEESPVSSRP